MIREAMGAIPYVNKRWDEEYVLWDVEDDPNDVSKIQIPQEVADQDISTWTEAFYKNAALPMLATEAKNMRQKAIGQTINFYGLSQDEASKICKSFVAYKPGYEGYIISIAPYISVGSRHGLGHVIREAEYGFYLGTLSRLPMTPAKVVGSANQRVIKWNRTFENELGLTPDDLKLSIMAVEDATADNSESIMSASEEEEKELAQIPSLDPKSKEYISFFQEWEKDPTQTWLNFKGMQIKFNPKGYDKFLRKFAAPWYDKALLKAVPAKNKKNKKGLEAPKRGYEGAMDRAEIKQEVARSKGQEFTKEQFNALVLEEKEALRREALTNANLMRKIYLNTKGWMKEDLTSNDPAVRAMVENVQVPYKYDIEAQKNDEEIEGIPPKLRGATYKKEYVRYLQSTLPNPSYKCFQGPFGAQEATSVRQSIKQKEANIKLLNEVWSLKNDPYLNEPRSYEDIAAIMNKTVSRKMKGKYAYTPQKIEEILNKIEANPKILQIGDTEEEPEVQELSETQESAPESEKAISTSVNYHDTLNQAINAARVTFSTAVNLDPHHGYNVSPASQRAIEVFNTPYEYTKEQLKTARIRLLVLKIKGGLNVPTYVKHVSDADMVFAVEGKIKQGIPDEEIVAQLMNGNVPDTTVKAKEEIPPKTKDEEPALDITPGGEKVPVPEEVTPPPVPVAADLTPEEEALLTPEEKEKRRQKGNKENPYDRDASNKNRIIIVATLKSLIKIAEDLDSEGKDDAAEEVHNLIRKYQGRI